MSRIQALTSKLYPYCIKVAEDKLEVPNSSPAPAMEPQKPGWVHQQANKMIDQGVDKLKGKVKEQVKGQTREYLENNGRDILRNLATLTGAERGARDFYNQVDGPEVASALREDVLPAYNRLIHSKAWQPIRNAALGYLQNSTPDDREALFNTLQRAYDYDGADPKALMWPKSSPYMSSAMSPYYNVYTGVSFRGNNSYLPDDPLLASKKLLQRGLNPSTFVYDIPYGYRLGANAGLLPSFTFMDMLKERNQSLADWLRTGAYATDSGRQLSELGTYAIGPKGTENIIKDNLDYLSTGIPKGWSSQLYNSIPVATDLAGRGMYSAGAHGAGSLVNKLLTRVGAKAWGGPVSAAITVPVDIANLDGAIGNIEKQTSLNGYSNYDPKTNTYKAPFLLRNPGSTELKPSNKSIIMAPTTFGEHPYDPNKLFRSMEWGNNDAYKYQLNHLRQLQKDDPENTQGIPYEELYKQPFLPVFTEQGDYVLAIPPRTRTWGENLEDWGKWRRGEPIKLREDQNWIVPVDNSGNPIPAKMPEDERWFAGARDAVRRAWTSAYNAFGGNRPNKRYDPALPLRLYGREIRKAHGELSPHPIFTQLNEAWGTMQSRQKALQDRQNQLKLDVAKAGGDALAWATNSDLVREANQLIKDISEFKNDVQQLYEEEARLQQEYDSPKEPTPNWTKPKPGSLFDMILPPQREPVPSWQQRMY